MNFAILEDHRVKVKERGKLDKYQDFDTELKNLLKNMKVTMITIIVGPFKQS